ncbi:unnamed protein product [Spirodela intermedia]|uniref:NB-ARC domain-containing protein n=1 Tax=Spirodela intermedia TaxID=51605 RepID=A0A7I8KU81_SPIIN|nr:unnamed protein product [Spirodela intermedia]
MAKIDEINRRRSTYGIQDLGGEPGRQIDNTVGERRRVVLHAPDPDLVCMDEEKNRILENLLDGSRKETTIAKRVFNEARAKFGHPVWIDVSQQYSAVDLLGDILSEVTKLNVKKLEQMTRAEYEAMLYQTMGAKKYLIVMDDVWDTDVWRMLNPHLPDAQNGSRVLITSLSVEVARSADTCTPPYELRFLTEE